MSFPRTRMRRLRRSELLRSFLRETRLSPKNFIYPLFVCPGKRIQREISSMPGNYHFSVDRIADECREIAALGVPALLLYGIPETKDERGSGAYGEKSIVAQAVRAIRNSVGDRLLIACDVCLCEYTSHGHCVLIKDERGSGAYGEKSIVAQAVRSIRNSVGDRLLNRARPWSPEYRTAGRRVRPGPR